MYVAIIGFRFFVSASEEEKNNYFIALNTVGKLGVTMGFSIIYFWCAEIFPTLIRNSLMGASSMFARVGSVFAPVIADIVSNKCDGSASSESLDVCFG